MPRRKSTALTAALAALLLLAACQTRLSPPPAPTLAPTTPAPKAVATRLLAREEGTLLLEGNCLRLKSSLYRPSGETVYTLAWVPDLAYTLDGDSLTVTSGLVAGTKEEVTLRIGSEIIVDGDSRNFLADEIKPSVPEGCAGPYWITNAIQPAGE